MFNVGIRKSSLKLIGMHGILQSVEYWAYLSGSNNISAIISYIFGW